MPARRRKLSPRAGVLEQMGLVTDQQVPWTVLDFGMAAENIVVDDHPAARECAEETGLVSARHLERNHQVAEGLPSGRFIDPSCLPQMGWADHQNAAISEGIRSNDADDGLTCPHFVCQQDSFGMPGSPNGSVLQGVNYLLD